MYVCSVGHPHTRPTPHIIARRPPASKALKFLHDLSLTHTEPCHLSPWSELELQALSLKGALRSYRLPGPQKNTKHWPFWLFIVALGHYLLHTIGVQVAVLGISVPKLGIHGAMFSDVRVVVLQRDRFMF